jgi:dolichol-phosphate mannosyltransferase
MNEAEAPRLSLVIPTYNERENIEQILLETARVLDRIPCEIIVVDDDSPDLGWRLVEQLRAAMPQVRLVRRMRQTRDQAQSLIEGFRVSRGQVLGKMDADGSHDPAALIAMLNAIDSGFEVAIGSRYVHGHRPGGRLPRRFLSRMSAALVRWLLWLEITDPLSGFWLIKRQVYQRAAMGDVSRGYKLLLAICVRGRVRKVAEIPIKFRERRHGRSKLSAMVLFRAARLALSLIVFKIGQTLGGKLRGGATR